MSAKRVYKIMKSIPRERIGREYGEQVIKIRDRMHRNHFSFRLFWDRHDGAAPREKGLGTADNGKLHGIYAGAVRVQRKLRGRRHDVVRLFYHRERLTLLRVGERYHLLFSEERRRRLARRHVHGECFSGEKSFKKNQR